MTDFNKMKAQLKSIQLAYESNADHIVNEKLEEGIKNLKSKIKSVKITSDPMEVNPVGKRNPSVFTPLEIADKAISSYKTNINRAPINDPDEDGATISTHATRTSANAMAASMMNIRSSGNAGKMTQSTPNGNGDLGRYSAPANNNDGNMGIGQGHYAAQVSSMTLEEYEEYYNKKYVAEEVEEVTPLVCGVCASDPCECEEEINPIKELQERLLELNDSAWQSIDIVMREMAHELEVTPKQLHNAFKAETGQIPDDWLRENRDVELCGYMPLDEAVAINKVGQVYEVSCMWRGQTMRLKFFWPSASLCSREECQNCCDMFYPGSRLLAHYPVKDEPDNYMVIVPPMKENYEFVPADTWEALDEDAQEFYDYICEEVGEPLTPMIYHDDEDAYHMVIEDHDTGEESLIVVEANKSGDSSLHDWFSKSKSSDGTKGWVQLGGKYAGKPCARQPGQKTKPKCGSSKMKRDLNKDEEQAAFRRKNREDGNPNRKGKAKNVRTEEVVDEACWKGYKKKGMKKMFGKMYPNCVKEEEYVTEISKDLATRAYAERRTNEYEGDEVHTKSDKTRDRIVKKHGEKAGKEADKAANKKIFGTEEYVMEDDMKGMSVSSGDKRPTESGAGLTAKGVAKYRRRNPGSKLQTAVTTPPSKLKPGSKAAGRRKSFCARSRGWTGERGKAARRRWNC